MNARAPVETALFALQMVVMLAAVSDETSFFFNRLGPASKHSLLKLSRMR
jgi:hypothetical protein